jgi:hypothetical protein
MTQIFLTPTDTDSQKLYCYTNRTNKIAIARLHGIVDRHCERVVFPGEQFLFEAEDSCELEISRQTNVGIIEDVIPCSQIKNLKKDS